MRLRTRLGGQKLLVANILQHLKIKDLEGGGGYPPSCFWEPFQTENNRKITRFRKKSLFRTIVISSVFARFGFLPSKMQSLNLRVFTVFRACVFTKHCKYQCFQKVFQKQCKIQHFGHVVLPKCRK